MGNPLIDAGKQVVDAGVSALGSVAQSTDLGGGGAGGNLISGTAPGIRSLDQAGGVIARTARSSAALQRHYQQRRNERHELLSSVPPNGDHAEQMRQVGGSFAAQAADAVASNDPAGAQNLYRRAADTYRDAAHLSEASPQAAASSLDAALNYQRAGDLPNAERQLAASDRAAAQWERNGATARERGDAALHRAAGTALGVRIAQEQGDAGLVATRLRAMDDALVRADRYYGKEAQGQLVAAQGGEPEAWKGYAAAMLQQRRVASSGADVYAATGIDLPPAVQNRISLQAQQQQQLMDSATQGGDARAKPLLALWPWHKVTRPVLRRGSSAADSPCPRWRWRPCNAK